MHHITGAGYLPRNRQGCLRGTRKDVLWQIECWLGDERDQRVFWLNGLAGTGKSTIAQTFAESSFADGKLGASFFCSRDFEDRRDIQNIFPTLAFQLAYRYPEFRKELLPVLRTNPEIGRESLCTQLEKVIIRPFKATHIPTLIVIDALDECKDEEPASAILSVLSRYVDQIPWVKFFITGRPEPRIRTGFRLELLRPITEVLKLHDVDRSLVDADIKLFLETRLTEIAKARSDCDFTESWPNSNDIDILCKKSAGLFIYASTVVKFVTSPYYLPAERLALIISLPQSTAHEGKSGIDSLYTQVLEQAFHDADLDAQELYSRFKLIVGAVLMVFYPLSRKTLSELFKNCGTPSHISNALRSLHSLLLVPDSEADPIRSFHKSFPDFLTDPTRCKDDRFFVDPLFYHIDVLFSCLNLMRERLRKNICDLDGCPPLSDVRDLPDRREAYIGGALEYACQFWTKHLSAVPSSGPHVERVKAEIDEFFTTHLLFWIEVLSLVEHLDLSVYALHDIDQWCLLVSCAGYPVKTHINVLQAGYSCKWTNDSHCLILSNFDHIRSSPTNLYHLALPFSPSSSWLHKWYTPESLREVRVVKGRLDKWGTSTREVHIRGLVGDLMCWKDVIAVGGTCGEITIIDGITGSRRMVLSTTGLHVFPLAFSLDGTLLVSGDAIRLWDIQTGGVVKEFRGRAKCASISPDATTIASGTHSDIRLWDVRTGVCCHVIVIDAAPGGVTCLNLLPTVPGHLMYVAGGLVQQWDINGREMRPTMAGHHITFSSDGKRFILCGKGSPTVHDTVSRTTIATLTSPGRNFRGCRFSPSNEFVAGVSDGTIYVWNVTDTPRLIGTCISHTRDITFLAYSSSLVSHDGISVVKFLRINGDSPDLTTRNTKSTASPPATIIFTTLQEDGIAISVDSTGVVERWDLSTGLPEVLLQIPEIKLVGDVRLVSGILTIACPGRPGGVGWDVSIWDIEARKMLQKKTLSGNTNVLHHSHNDDFGISKDGTLFFGAGSGEIRTWSVSTGESTGSLTVDEYHCGTPYFFDGSIFWVKSSSQPSFPARGWDLRNLKSPPFWSLNLPNKRRFVFQMRGTYSDNPRGTITDTTSKTVVFSLPITPMRDRQAWDGRYLFGISEDGEVLILDFAHMNFR